LDFSVKEFQKAMSSLGEAMTTSVLYTNDARLSTVTGYEKRDCHFKRLASAEIRRQFSALAGRSLQYSENRAPAASRKLFACWIT
jgi:hypothetical protein